MMPKVAMVTPRYRPLVGGVERHVEEVSRRMAASGMDVTVLTIDPSGRLPPVERDGTLVVRRFPATPRRTDLSVSRPLVEAATNGQYDLVHVQGVHTLVPPIVLAAAQRAGLPTVVTFHTGGSSSRIRSAVREAQWRALRPLLRRANGLIAVCGYEVGAFARRLGIDPARIHLIRNGADPLPVGVQAAPVTGSPLICSIGRLERYKGHHRLVGAMPGLLRLEPRAHLALVGRGPYEQKLRRLVHRLGVGHAVSFISFGNDQRETLGALVASSDVIALLSDYEANPVAVMEALALGRRVVVAATSGLREFSSAGWATAVSLHTPPAALAAILADVAARPDDGPRELPSWDDCVDRMLALYGEVAGVDHG